MEAVRAERRTGRYERKREAILDAAARLFNKQGLKGATLAEVAASVGLITTSVTYYYRKKEDLAAACSVRTIEAYERLLEQAEAAPTPEARLARFLELYFAMLADIAAGERPELITFWDLRGLSGRHAEEVFARYVDLFRKIRRVFFAHGFERTDRNARAHLLFSLITWSRAWFRRYEPEDYPRAARWTADILTRGLAAPGWRWRPLRLDEAQLAPPDGAAESFLQAATRLVNEQGYHGASVEKISERLGVTKGSFYHHHDTKHDLVADCFERSFEAVRRAQRAAAAAPAPSGWDRLTGCADLLVRHQLSEHGPLLRYTALAAVPESIRPQLLATMQRLSERFAGMAADGIADGSIRAVDPMIAAQLINGMINAAADLTYWAPAATRDNVATLFARPLFEGLWSA